MFGFDVEIVGESSVAGVVGEGRDQATDVVNVVLANFFLEAVINKESVHGLRISIKCTVVTSKAWVKLWYGMG